MRVSTWLVAGAAVLAVIGVTVTTLSLLAPRSAPVQVASEQDSIAARVASLTGALTRAAELSGSETGSEARAGEAIARAQRRTAALSARLSALSAPVAESERLTHVETVMKRSQESLPTVNTAQTRLARARLDSAVNAIQVIRELANARDEATADSLREARQELDAIRLELDSALARLADFVRQLADYRQALDSVQLRAVAVSEALDRSNIQASPAGSGGGQHEGYSIAGLLAFLGSTSSLLLAWRAERRESTRFRIEMRRLQAVGSDRQDVPASP